MKFVENILELKGKKDNMNVENFVFCWNATTGKYEFTEDELKKLLEGIISKKQSVITEKGIKILKAMQENKEKYLNVFTSKQLGELVAMAPRSVSGSMKKLINQGYVEKKGISPVSYGLTSGGDALQLDN